MASLDPNDFVGQDPFDNTSFTINLKLDTADALKVTRDFGSEKRMGVPSHEWTDVSILQPPEDDISYSAKERFVYEYEKYRTAKENDLVLKFNNNITVYKFDARFAWALSNCTESGGSTPWITETLSSTTLSAKSGHTLGKGDAVAEHNFIFDVEITRFEDSTPKTFFFRILDDSSMQEFQSKSPPFLVTLEELVLNENLKFPSTLSIVGKILNDTGARNIVPDAFMEVETALDKLTNAKATVEADKSAALAAKATAEAAQATAEADKLAALAAKATAEADKAAALSDKLTAETDKAAALSDKLTAESDKAAALSDKLTAESDKAAALAAKATAEAAQATAEAAKATAVHERELALRWVPLASPLQTADSVANLLVENDKFKIQIKELQESVALQQSITAAFRAADCTDDFPSREESDTPTSTYFDP